MKQVTLNHNERYFIFEEESKKKEKACQPTKWVVQVGVQSPTTVVSSEASRFFLSTDVLRYLYLRQFTLFPHFVFSRWVDAFSSIHFPKEGPFRFDIFHFIAPLMDPFNQIYEISSSPTETVSIPVVFSFAIHTRSANNTTFPMLQPESRS